MLFGLALVIASACVFNNYLDKDIDKKMARTKNRALAKGSIGSTQALAFASVLGFAGFSILLVGTNFLTAAVAWAGYIIYIFAYGFLKRTSVFSTLVGSIAGAVPPVVGYTAFSDHLDGGALILFLILVFWQMPHFYAIAIYRHDDYKSADLPVLPVVKGFRTAKFNILIYAFGFILAVVALTVFGYTGYTYLAIALVLALTWFGRILQGFSAKDDKKWARGVFMHSLIVISLLSGLIAVGPLLP
jgi:heme o synthase